MQDTAVLDTDQAEQSLIGAALITSGRVLDEVDIEPEDFAAPAHEGVWRLILEMRARGEATDLVTVNRALQTADESLRRMVTPVVLARFMHDTLSPANASYYANIVNDGALRRRIMEASTRIAQAVSETATSEDLIDLARSEVEAAAKVSVTGVQAIGATIEETLDDLDREPTFIPTPWAALNHLIGGFRPGALYVVGARPGAGKTIIGLQSALEMSKFGAVAFSTLEMSEPEMHKRVIAQLSRVPMGALVNSELSVEQRQRVRESLSLYRKIPLFIDDRSDVSVPMIKGFARSVQRRKPLAGVVVDYLQLITASKALRSKPRHEQVADMSRQLKKFAREMNVPVIALSQLNRESANRENSKPQMSDLRESGAIEQDADVIILLHRDDTHPEDLGMHVVKNRHGMRQEFQLDWWGQFSQVTDRGFRP